MQRRLLLLLDDTGQNKNKSTYLLYRIYVILDMNELFCEYCISIGVNIDECMDIFNTIKYEKSF